MSDFGMLCRDVSHVTSIRDDVTDSVLWLPPMRNYLIYEKV